MTTPEENKEIVRRLYDEENKGRVDVVDELMSPDFVMHGDALAPLVKGTEFVKQSVLGVRQAFPDLTVTIEDLIAEGDKVTARLRWRGTHTGDFMGIPGVGKKMTWTAIAINRFEDGRIVERWFNADSLGMLQQFGLVPAPGGPPGGAPEPAASGAGGRD